MITEDRVTIFTKNTGKYSGIALVMDLTRQINHTYGSTVASHPIEGSGNTVADHQYLKNVKLQIAGHISNSVKVPELNASANEFVGTRERTAVTSELNDISNSISNDFSVIQDKIAPEVPLTADQADILNEYSEEVLYTAGQTLTNDEYTAGFAVTQENANKLNNSVIEAIATTEDNNAAIEKEKESTGTRRIYSNSQLNKQLDALILLENIRDNRLLVDILTPLRLYENMTINFNIPRNMRQGTALELNITCEQQRFFEAEVTSVPYSKESGIADTSEKQDEKPSEATDELSARAERYAGEIKKQYEGGL